MKSMTFETDEILHFGDMYQAKRPFLEIHRTDESDEIDEIWYRPKNPPLLLASDTSSMLAIFQTPIDNWPSVH